MKTKRWMTWTVWPLLAAAGCSTTSNASDGSDSGAANDTSAPVDVAAPADTSDANVPMDVVDPFDAVEPEDVIEPADTPSAGDVTDPSDTAEPAITVATPGARCDLADRIGVIELSGLTDEPPFPYLVATLNDRPNPWYGQPALSTEVCRHHAFKPTGICEDPCGVDETCSIDGTCAPLPVRVKDATLRLFAGDETQTFSPDPALGYLEGAITLPGKSFGLELTWSGQTVTLAAAEAPAALPQLAGTLVGSYDAPEKVTITWTPVAEGTHAYTLIPINHHAAGPTFTECAAPASLGGFEVPEAMLTPLAVSTGLEFQGVEHVRFAAAETPIGCVEIRMLTRHYLSLGF